MKKFVSLILCAVLCLTLALPVFAAEPEADAVDNIEPKVVSYYRCKENAKVYQEKNGTKSTTVLGIMLVGEDYNGLSVTLANYIRGYPVNGNLYNTYSGWGSSLFGYTIRSAYSFLGNDSPWSENSEVVE